MWVLTRDSLVRRTTPVLIHINDEIHPLETVKGSIREIGILTELYEIFQCTCCYVLCRVLNDL